MKFLKRTLFALAVAGLMGAGGAQAASVSSTLFNGFQQLSDNSAESLINGPCAAGAACSATTLDLGDRLRGVAAFERDVLEPWIFEAALHHAVHVVPVGAVAVDVRMVLLAAVTDLLQAAVGAAPRTRVPAPTPDNVGSDAVIGRAPRRHA